MSVYRFPYNLTPKAIWGEVRYLRTRIRAAYQRARFGWAEWDIHGPGFSGSVMPALGHQLVYFSDATIGYPGQGEYDDYDKWTADMRKHGQALIDGANEPEMPQIMIDHYNTMRFKKIDGTNYSTMVFDDEPQGLDEARDGYYAEIERRQAAAREALHWVADNYGSLWD